NFLPKNQMTANQAYNLIHDELMLDGNAKLNLATFVTTWMEPAAEKLMAETFDKNMIDKDEYPQTAEIEKRCVRIVSNLFNAPDNSIGASSVGSSEAVMLAGMAFKWNWKKRQKAQNRHTDKPNLVLGANVQIVWEKFCRYWEIEPRYIPMEKGRYVITPEEVVNHCDENTIGVVAILGTTFTGEFEPIEAINDALAQLNAEKSWEIPLHIDAASGGFVAPFLHPDLAWDFRLSEVKSINVSGHKYGLVYPGIGFVIWKDHDDLPQELIFHVNYLGGDVPTFTLNFSRPGNQVVAQYYNFLRLGREGYTDIMKVLQSTAMHLSCEIAKMAPFELISNGESEPVFAFKLRDEISKYSVYNISDKLREKGWQIPAYTMPEHAEEIAVLRIVVREGFSYDMADILLSDIKRAVEYFEKLPITLESSEYTGFSH
ncbi:MAG: glutamate decarboxylase, partial [Campylobacterota bacterium]|nr:glutamate decarboxylase [Campylobacterota bacterium]